MSLTPGSDKSDSERSERSSASPRKVKKSLIADSSDEDEVRRVWPLSTIVLYFFTLMLPALRKTRVGPRRTLHRLLIYSEMMYCRRIRMMSEVMLSKRRGLTTRMGTSRTLVEKVSFFDLCFHCFMLFMKVLLVG